MPLTRIPSGAMVFVDANILTYYFLEVHPFIEACDAFFDRVVNREIRAFTSADVAADVIHRVMVGEAIIQFGLEARKAVSYLKAHPDVVKQLHIIRPSLVSSPMLGFTFWTLLTVSYTTASAIVASTVC